MRLVSPSAFACLALTASSAGAWAGTYTFNTTTGQVLLNGAASSTINGTAVVAEGVTNNIRQWAVLGDLNLGATDTLTFVSNGAGAGNYAGSLLVGNNVTIAPGARVDASANGITPGAGGGAGGATGGFGGAGGAGAAGAQVVNSLLTVVPANQAPAAGGIGGVGGFVEQGVLNNAQFPSLPGLSGASGPAANSGSLGAAGTLGAFGQDGVNASGSGGISVAQPNTGISLPGDPGAGGAGGAAGALIDSAFGFAIANGNSGLQGAAGGDGGTGGAVAPQAPESGGNGRQTTTPATLIGGGGGGAAGSGGFGGTGGGQGGMGGGGGGGGGGSNGFILGFALPGGSGNGGGTGGFGGAGGQGGQGGQGGSGGAGGGAFQIIAQGRLTSGATLSARGGTGQQGTPGTAGTAGLVGAAGGPGLPGAQGVSGGLFTGGNGGDGGTGGAGGQGGAGSAGSAGGMGGRGGGGDVRLSGSVLTLTAAPVTPQPFDSTVGRAILGSNQGQSSLVTQVQTVAPGTLGSTVDYHFTGGTQGLNPFIAGGSTLTPYIPDLVGGAERFGLLTLTAQAADFATVRAGEPAGAVGALVRLALGPTGYANAFPGFDTLLFINLSGKDLLNPELGVAPLGGGTAFAQALLTEGFLNDPAFGGNGVLTLGSLGASDIYATLVPTGDTLLNAMVNGAGPITDATLADGGVLYLRANTVPEPSSLVLFAGGLIGLALTRRRELTKGP